MMIKGGKIQKANKKSLNAKGKNKVNGKGKDKKGQLEKDCPVSLAECRRRGSKWPLAKDLGLKGKRKQGALYLYGGNGVVHKLSSNWESFDLVYLKAL
ncbi:hypothetical protein Tco_0499105 [Tanacetum coccineum]